MRREFAVNGIRMDGKGQISLFIYDNDTFVIYPYVDNNTFDSDITVFVKNAESLSPLNGGKEIKPLYTLKGESAFKLRAQSGKFDAYKINR